MTQFESSTPKLLPDVRRISISGSMKEELNPGTDSMKYKATKMRWVILILFVIYSTANSMQWTQYSIIGKIVHEYYGVSFNLVWWTSMVYMITYVPLIFPASWLLDKTNLIGDADPITNPFYYAQDRESWYAEVAAKSREEYKKQKAEEQEAIKKKKIKSKCFKNTSFVMRKEPGQVRNLIQIYIHNLDNSNMDKINLDPDSAGVSVQYLVTSDYDDVMNETEHLVSKIVKKLSRHNV